MNWEIVDIKEAVRLDDFGNLQRTRLVRYRAHGQGPFTIEVPEARFTSEHVKQLLDAAAAHVGALVPRP